MNSYPDQMVEAAIRYRTEQIAQEWAPVRRRRARRRHDRLRELARGGRDVA
jgi:hypothetical protein